MTKGRILLVEDETDLLLNNIEYLQKMGYTTIMAETLEDAGRILREFQIDLILLDINMPDGSGLDFIKEIRERSEVPVIFLTCRTDKDDVLQGLRSGGCDYITKPYDLDILSARIDAQLRINQTMPKNKFSLGALSIDLITQQAFINGEDIRLTPKEFALLHLFMKNPKRQYTPDELYYSVWGKDANKDVRTVQVRVSGLRKKLDPEKTKINIVMQDRKYYKLSLFG